MQHYRSGFLDQCVTTLKIQKLMSFTTQPLLDGALIGAGAVADEHSVKAKTCLFQLGSPSATGPSRGALLKPPPQQTLSKQLSKAF
jgi:hypothetical protein